MEYEFEAELWIWDAMQKGTWYFVTLPVDMAEEIKEITSTGVKRGFGSVKVEVTVGENVWKTSVFPSTEDKSYVLPIKKSVREDVGVEEGEKMKVKIKLIELG